MTQETPVFVTADGRPRRRHRLLGATVGALTGAWVAGVCIGAPGFLALPALPALRPVADVVPRDHRDARTVTPISYRRRELHADRVELARERGAEVRFQ